MEEVERRGTVTPQIDQITAALIDAQSEFPEIKKDAKADIPTKSGGSYSYKYATLSEILKAIRPALKKNGLSLIQTMSYDENVGGIQAQLLHTSGQRIVSGLPIDFTTYGGQPQQLGSLLTYYRRYLITALLNLAPDEDDDAQAAQGWSPPESQGPMKPREFKPSTNPVTKPQLNRLFAITRTRQWQDVQVAEAMRTMFKIEKSTELNMTQYGELIAVIESKTFDEWAQGVLGADPSNRG